MKTFSTLTFLPGPDVLVFFRSPCKPKDSKVMLPKSNPTVSLNRRQPQSLTNRNHAYPRRKRGKRRSITAFSKAITNATGRCIACLLGLLSTDSSSSLTSSSVFRTVGVALICSLFTISAACSMKMSVFSRLAGMDFPQGSAALASRYDEKWKGSEGHSTWNVDLSQTR